MRVPLPRHAREHVGRSRVGPNRWWGVARVVFRIELSQSPLAGVPNQNGQNPLDKAYDNTTCRAT